MTCLHDLGERAAKAAFEGHCPICLAICWQTLRQALKAHETRNVKVEVGSVLRFMNHLESKDRP